MKTLNVLTIIGFMCLASCNERSASSDVKNSQLQIVADTDSSIAGNVKDPTAAKPDSRANPGSKDPKDPTSANPTATPTEPKKEDPTTPPKGSVAVCKDAKGNDVFGDPALGEANKLVHEKTGYFFACEKLEQLNDMHCSNSNTEGCQVLAQTVKACYMRRHCSLNGVVDETKLQQDYYDLLSSGNTTSLSDPSIGQVYLFNIEDIAFDSRDYLKVGGTDWKKYYDSLDSVCIKLRWAGNKAKLPAKYGELYDKYCNCACDSYQATPGDRD